MMDDRIREHLKRLNKYYLHLLDAMKGLGVIDDNFCHRLVKMAKFRNRLVHLYWEIDKEVTHITIIQSVYV